MNPTEIIERAMRGATVTPTQGNLEIAFVPAQLQAVMAMLTNEARTQKVLEALWEAMVHALEQATDKTAEENDREQAKPQPAYGI